MTADEKSKAESDIRTIMNAIDTEAEQIGGLENLDSESLLELLKRVKKGVEDGDNDVDITHLDNFIATLEASEEKIAKSLNDLKVTNASEALITGTVCVKTVTTAVICTLYSALTETYKGTFGEDSHGIKDKKLLEALKKQTVERMNAEQDARAKDDGVTGEKTITMENLDKILEGEKGIEKLKKLLIGTDNEEGKENDPKDQTTER